MENSTFTLSQNGVEKFTGTENECYFKLQRLQGQSADWAIKYEGWKIEPAKKVNVYSFYEKTILDSIDFSDYGYNNDAYLYDKIKTLYNIFKSEYVHQNNQNKSLPFLFSEWLRGLPSVCSVPYNYHEILENANKYIKDNDDKNLRLSLRKEDDFLEDYWSNLSKAFFTLKENL